MRFERMIRLTMLAGVAWALPAAAPVASAAGMPVQSAPQSADAYQWIDRADALWDAIGDSPPDTAFGFEGQEPWAWQMGDGHTVIVEDAGPEGIRSYYFAPGATAPFLAVEPGMSFAFEGGRLAMVYDADGEAAPRAEFGDYSDAALDLYARGRRLYQALAGRDYRPVDTSAWIDASPYIFGFIQLWDEGRTRYPDWRRYHARNDASAWRRRFEAEQRRRREQALRFSHWRQGGFQGPPPGRYHHPDRPTAGYPNQPGSGWSRPGGPGRPGRPGGLGTPGTNPPPRPGTTPPPVTTPGNPAPPPFTRPAPDRPDGTPGWRRGQPRPRPDGNGAGRPPAPPVTAPSPGTVETPRPPRPRPDGNGWGRPPAPPVTSTPPGTVETPRPPRPRPDGNGWGRPPAPPVTSTPPVSVDAPPAPRPRPEGGWRPRPAPSGGAPDAAPAPQFRPRPSYTPPAPSASPPPSRPSYTPPAPRPSYTPPAPSASPPPSRPSYTPPAPSRPAPTPRKMSADDAGTPQ